MAGGITGLGIGKSDEWMTPPSVFEALGERFDLDVAAPISGPLHVPAACWFSSDSLEREWDGFVWMNPPFGGRNGIWPWMNKFLAHGNGIALTPDRTPSPWFQDSWHRADALLFCRKTPFLLPDGSVAGSPAFGTTLWASGPRAVLALRRAAENRFGLLAFPAFGSTVAELWGVAATRANSSRGRSGEAHVAAMGTHQTGSVRTAERGADR